MTEQDKDTLLRFVDGQLGPDEAAAFEARLADDPALAAEAAEFAELGNLLRRHTDEIVQAADFSGFADRITSELAQAGGVEAAPTPARPAPPTAEPLGQRLKAWWARHWTPVVVSAGAAAAVAFFVVRAVGPGAVGGGGGVDEGVETDAPVAVEAVRNDGNKTVLISSPGDEEGGATVIWLLDGEEDEGDASLTEDPI
ncbi:MAG: hypothetical protein H6704_00355 [Myxococcales bacterium]|nr:hypothetical protein [Myxococcales bacterium]